MAFYPPPGSQPHSVYSPLPPVTAYPASSYHPSRRSRRHSTSSFSSYPPVPPGNYGLNSYPDGYGQGYSGVPTIASTSHNGQVYTIPQQPQPVIPRAQTQLPYFRNPYIPPSSTVPGRTMGPDTMPPSSTVPGRTIGPNTMPPSSTVPPYFRNPYIPPSSTVPGRTIGPDTMPPSSAVPGRTMGPGAMPPSSTVPGRTMGPGTMRYNYQGNQSYYPMQGNQVDQPQTIVVKMDGGRRRPRRPHYRRRSSSY